MIRSSPRYEEPKGRGGGWTGRDNVANVRGILVYTHVYTYMYVCENSNKTIVASVTHLCGRMLALE